MISLLNHIHTHDFSSISSPYFSSPAQSDITGILESIRDKCFKKAAAAEAREKKEKPDKNEKSEKTEKAEKIAKIPKTKVTKEKVERKDKKDKIDVNEMEIDVVAGMSMGMGTENKEIRNENIGIIEERTRGRERGSDKVGMMREKSADGEWRTFGGISNEDAADFFSDAFPLSPFPLSPASQKLVTLHKSSSSSSSSSTSSSSFQGIFNTVI